MIQKASIGEKIRLMREAEGLSRREMGLLTGVSPSNLKNYEILGRQIPADTLILILNIDRFHKYSDWVIFNKTNPAAGQISPALSPDGSEKPEEHHGLIPGTAKSRR